MPISALPFAAVLAAPGAVDLSGQDLGGLRLTPGVYHFATSAQLTGTLLLDAVGNQHGQFVFQIGTTLITAANATIGMVGGGTADNVFFAVGSSATLGTDTRFIGSILAQTSISLNDGAQVEGRVLARDAAVTLTRNVVALPLALPLPMNAVPEPAQWALFVAGFGMVGIVARRRQRALPFA